jgi:replicative DNA helicase
MSAEPVPLRSLNVIEPPAFSAPERAGVGLRADLANKAIAPTKVMGTGLWQLDSALNGGFRAGEVTVVAAPTGHGKSAFAEQIALYVSQKARTTFFALEMGKRRTELRMLGKMMRMDQRSIWNLISNKPDHPDLLKAVDSLSYEHMLYIEERSEDERFDSDMMFKMAWTNKPQFIVLDHPRHLDDWNGMSKDRSDLAASAIMRRLVACAKYFNAHVLVCAQTKVKLQKGRPIAQDIADTYVIAQAADAVIMIHRPFRGQGEEDHVAELIVDKNRNGPEGIIHTRWHGMSMSYSDMLHSEEKALTCCGPKKRKEKET